MARLSLQNNRRRKIVVLTIWTQICTILRSLMTILSEIVVLSVSKLSIKSYEMKFYANRNYIRKLVYTDDITCTEQLRMDRKTFSKLCHMLQDIGGLRSTRNMLVDEQVAMFLYILAHHFKNRVIKYNFGRFSETVSRYFHKVLNATLRLQAHLYKKPTPIATDSTDNHWKWFKNYLGALDGTYIRIRALLIDKPRYRTRKGEIATNVLGVCTPDMQFTYVLPGWEGSAADERVLRDAISREHGLRVPTGCYYLVDAGYTNCEGFLTPFRGRRYHLNEWLQGHQPRNDEELFNLRHASARNVIERCFGLLKIRWTILRSPSFYPVRVHNRIIVACCLLHNFIRREMTIDHMEDQLNEIVGDNNSEDVDHIAEIQTSDAWNTGRKQLAIEMFNEWRSLSR